VTPEEKLCSRFWRLRNSAGVLWPILSAGVLGCVVFLVRGFKSKTRLWIVLGIVFGAIDLGLLISMSFIDSGTKANPSHTTAADVQRTVMFINWVASSVMAFVINRKWLIWKAHNGRAWYQTAPSSPQPLRTSASNQGADTRSIFQGSPSGAIRSASREYAPSSAPVKINEASSEELQQALGLDAASADRIVQCRAQNGGFPSFPQLLAATNLPPHLLIPLEHRFDFAPAQTSGGGRRRLFE
jgi:hypothetical protein